MYWCIGTECIWPLNGKMESVPDVSVESPSLTVRVSQVRTGDVDAEKRLRKDLKRTKALLADAQIMLDHIKNNAPSKREIAQLKNQVQRTQIINI